MAIRYDIGSLRAPEQLPDGRLRVDGHLTRTGVFEYRNADGSTRREYRPDAEVFRGSSLESFSDAPVTDDHPPVMLSAENYREHAVGHVSGAPRRDGDLVAARLVLSDAATIAKVKAGKVELSCGYECDLDPTPGVTPDGERYDAVQTNIRGNHVAIVEVARAGRSARMRLDAADMIPAPHSTESPMIKPEDHAKVLADLATATARADAAEAALAAAKTEAEAAAAAAAEALTAATERADKADADLAAERAARADAATIDRAAERARYDLERAAAEHLGAEFKFDGVSDREIRAAVVAKLEPDVRLDGRDDGYVECAYDNALRAAKAANDAVAGLRFKTEEGRQDAGAGATGEADRARAEMVERNRNAYKPAK